LRKNIRNLIIGVAITGIFLTLFFVSNTPVEAQSYNITIPYGGDFSVYSEGIMDTTGDIYWSFSATNNVYLDVWICDDYNYDIFDGGGTAEGYHVSNFEDYYDSGTFDIPYEDKWYVIFMNNDYYEYTSTSVSITVNFHGVQTGSNLILILVIVIPVVVVIAIVGLAVGLSVRNKRKKAEIVQTPLYQQPVGTYQQPTYYAPVQPMQPQPIQSQPMQTKICNNCGSTNKIENRFCVSCGSDMSEP